MKIKLPSPDTLLKVGIVVVSLIAGGSAYRSHNAIAEMKAENAAACPICQKANVTCEVKGELVFKK